MHSLSQLKVTHKSRNKSGDHTSKGAIIQTTDLLNQPLSVGVSHLLHTLATGLSTFASLVVVGHRLFAYPGWANAIVGHRNPVFPDISHCLLCLCHNRAHRVSRGPRVGHLGRLVCSLRYLRDPSTTLSFRRLLRLFARPILSSLSHTCY